MVPLIRSWLRADMAGNICFPHSRFYRHIIQSLNENSTWKTHHHLQLRLITPQCGSAPPISFKSAFLPRPIILQGSTLKDLHPRNPPFCS
ncbi:hypothetical protein CHARACLAT_011156 [Characodon lateralis]|uniref:Uncharacterized protein n=1 Tax=Characodon lateralis TaxID=208331 RepID=A0ABU7DFL9_9TELE|nr:hypothetical protein [Characodon lateralis]